LVSNQFCVTCGFGVYSITGTPGLEGALVTLLNKAVVAVNQPRVDQCFIGCAGL
jgi:hypothetical protein